jgi:hypothetical protein
MLGTPRNLGLGIARSLGNKKYTYPKKKRLICLGIICWEFVVELEGSLMRERDRDSHKGDV